MYSCRSPDETIFRTCSHSAQFFQGTPFAEVEEVIYIGTGASAVKISRAKCVSAPTSPAQTDFGWIHRISPQLIIIIIIIMRNPLKLSGNQAIKLATWNVRTPNSKSQQENLIRDLTCRDIGVVCLQEVRLPGPSSYVLDNSHIEGDT